LVQGALGPEVLLQAGERLGEEPNALGRAVGAAAPAVLWRLIERGRAPGGADALLASMRRTGAARALADPLGRLQRDGRADTDLLGEDFAGRIAAFARIGEGSAGAVLAMLTPLGLGALARIAPTPLNADTLGRTLREQENNVERAFPPGFELSGAEAPTLAPEPEARPLVETTAEAAQAHRNPEAAAASEPRPELPSTPGPAPAAQPPAATAAAREGGAGMPKWLLPLLAALVLLAVVITVVRGMGAEETAPSTPGQAAEGVAGGPAGAASTP
jgi:hypothetical protein